MSGERYIGIAEMEISDNPATTLVAANLGSCLGIAAYDRKKKLGGMIHCLLPLSKSDPEKAVSKPTMYVDTGVTQLLTMLTAKGCSLKDLEINVAGGAQINDANNFFEIGKKNYTVLRKLLWKNNLLIKAENVGGTSSRTILLKIETGEVWLKMGGESFQLNK